MSRPWMVSIVALCLVLSVSVTGCKKKQPTTPDEKMDMVETPAPAEPVAPPPAPSTMDDVEAKNWYDDLDVRALNEEAIRKGFHPNVYFDFDQSDLKEEARQKLADNARFLRDNAALQVSVEGHCDERGTNEYNIALGESRANNARDYLAQLGVDRNRFNTISYGEERPVCTESDESCWWQNRRAYFVLRHGA